MKTLTVTLLEGNNQLNASLSLITGNLFVKVTDSFGSVLQGVSVSIAGMTAITDSSGNCSFSGLIPGNYTITFTKAGYE